MLCTGNKKALDKALSGQKYTAKQLYGVSLKNLCSNYIDKGIPVILWATMYMNTPYISSTWTYNGKTINWIAPEHCLLLVGYDSSHYIFNDPLTSQPQTYYSKSSVETAYKGLNYQAIVLEKRIIVRLHQRLPLYINTVLLKIPKQKKYIPLCCMKMENLYSTCLSV